MEKSQDAFRTISEVAIDLDTPAHVLRFWESRFPQIKPVKRAGGRRYYRPADVALLGGIRHLLHNEGLTIRGVQKMLREQGVRRIASLSGQEVDPDFDAALALAEGTRFDLSEPPPPAEIVNIQSWRPAATVQEPPHQLPEVTALPAPPSPDQPSLPFDLFEQPKRQTPLILSAGDPVWPSVEIATFEAAQAEDLQMSGAEFANQPPDADLTTTPSAPIEEDLSPQGAETVPEVTLAAVGEPAQTLPESPPVASTPPQDPNLIWLPSRLRALSRGALAGQADDLRLLIDRLTNLRDRLAKATSRNRI